MTHREPALYVNMYAHMQRLLQAPCSVCFTKAMSSSLVLLSTALPLQSPFKLCYVDNFPGSSSDFTLSAVLLFSLPLSPCSSLRWCCIIIYSCLHFPATQAFPPRTVYSCNHFQVFSHVVRCLGKPTKFKVYWYLKLFLKLACVKILTEQCWLTRWWHAKLDEHLYSDYCCLVFPFILPQLTVFSPLFLYFLKLTLIIKYDLPFLPFMYNTLHNVFLQSFTGLRQQDDIYDVKNN